MLRAALVAGWRGLFLGKKPSSIVNGAIRTSRGCAVAHHFYPLIINSYVLQRKNDNKDVDRCAGRFGGERCWRLTKPSPNKSPEIPSLSNGKDAASPPLVVVGGITFY